MNLRGIIKRTLYELRPGRCKWFWYYGCKIYFPKGNIVFRLACDQGIYEWQAVRLIDRFLAPGSTYFDIGANIGLMAVTALSSRPDCQRGLYRGLADNIGLYLGRRDNSGYVGRWTIVPKAIGAEVGKAYVL